MGVFSPERVILFSKDMRGFAVIGLEMMTRHRPPIHCGDDIRDVFLKSNRLAVTSLAAGDYASDAPF